MNIKNIFVLGIINLIIINLLVINFSFAEELQEINQNEVTEEIIEAEEYPKIYSEAAILMELNTGKVLYEKNIHDKKYPASTTKILTCILALENCDLDETQVASDAAVNSIKSGYSTANIQVGEEFTIGQLIDVMMLQSANEAANIIAEHISGSISEFAKLMNEKAIEIGCQDSHFVNPNGMHNESHYSSAYDLALIERYCMQNEEYRKILLKEKCELEDTEIWENYKIENDKTDEPYREFKNTNKLLREDNQYYYKYCTGGKTGFTTPAKNCFIANSNKNDFELISVILHAESTDDEKSARYVDTITLFNYGYDNFNKKDIYDEYNYEEPYKGMFYNISQKESIFDNNEDEIKKQDFKFLVSIIIGFLLFMVGILILIKTRRKENRDSLYKYNLKK